MNTQHDASKRTTGSRFSPTNPACLSGSLRSYGAKLRQKTKLGHPMETLFGELDVVQVVALLDSNRQFSGTEGICRAPRVGDVATIVHVLENDRHFIVEAVDANGFTLWLADFDAKELKLKVKYRADI